MYEMRKEEVERHHWDERREFEIVQKYVALGKKKLPDSQFRQEFQRILNEYRRQDPTFDPYQGITEMPTVSKETRVTCPKCFDDFYLALKFTATSGSDNEFHI